MALLLVLASINLTRTTLEIVKSSKRLEDIKDEISSLEQEKSTLANSINYKKSDSYVEKVARDELNMVKPGESVYVVNDQNSSQQNVVTAEDVLSSSSSRQNGAKLTFAERKRNIRLWWALLFDNRGIF